MRRAVLVTAIVVLIFIVEPIAQVTVVEANPFSGPSIEVLSPVYYKARIYLTTTIPLSIHIDSGLRTKIVDISYSLDGDLNRTLSFSNPYGNSPYFYEASGTLENLTNGLHSIAAYASDTQGKVISTSTTFLVNTTYSFPTMLLSPLNITYDVSEIPLTYSINEPTKYMIFYALDSSYHSITRNTTLTMPYDGQHTITIRAMDSFGLYSEQTTDFSVDTTNPSSVPTSTVPEFSWLAILPLFISLLFISVILKHRKTTKLNQ